MNLAPIPDATPEREPLDITTTTCRICPSATSLEVGSVRFHRALTGQDVRRTHIRTVEMHEVVRDESGIGVMQVGFEEDAPKAHRRCGRVQRRAAAHEREPAHDTGMTMMTSKRHKVHADADRLLDAPIVGRGRVPEHATSWARAAHLDLPK